MPLTTLDLNSALIVIDLQKGILAIPAVHPITDMIGRAAQLARAFRERSQTVVFVNVTAGAPGRTDAGRTQLSGFPPDFAELVPELGREPSDHLVTKQRWGAFTGTDLDEYLRNRGVTQVFITGVATSIGVESTARFAHELGYNVVLITDAVTDRDPDGHRNSVEKIFPRLGESTTTGEVLRLLGV